MTTLELTGLQVLQILEHSVKQLPLLNGCNVSTSKNLSYNYSKNSKCVTNVKLDGIDVEPQSMYAICMSSFIASGKGGYNFLKPSPVIHNKDDLHLLRIFEPLITMANDVQTIGWARSYCSPTTCTDRMVCTCS